MPPRCAEPRAARRLGGMAPARCHAAAWALAARPIGSQGLGTRRDARRCAHASSRVSASGTWGPP
jgi:hypothetical protein